MCVGSAHNAGTVAVESLTCSASHRGTSERKGTEPLKHTHRVPYVGKHHTSTACFVKQQTTAFFFLST